jgi:arylsulfatase A
MWGNRVLSCSGYREPGIVWWPGKIKPGSRSNSLVTTYDMFPTALALAGVALPADRIIDGVDMGPVIFSSHPETASGGHDCIFFYKSPESQEGPQGAAKLSSLAAIRCGDYKTYYLIDGGSSTPLPPGVQTGVLSLEEPIVFDLSKDWSEDKPLDKESPEYINAKSVSAAARAKHLKTMGWNINQMGKLSPAIHSSWMLPNR